MELFRVTRFLYKDDLSGNGAALHGGRWNHKPYPVLYCAGSRSLAMLETLVHLKQNQPPDDYCIVVLYVPDSASIQIVSEKDLAPDWKLNQDITRNLGTSWLNQPSSLILRVPSVIVKAEWNYLINPRHPDFEQVKVIDSEPTQFDERFFSRNF